MTVYQSVYNYNINLKFKTLLKLQKSNVVTDKVPPIFVHRKERQRDVTEGLSKEDRSNQC